VNILKKKSEASEEDSKRLTQRSTNFPKI